MRWNGHHTQWRDLDSRAATLKAISVQHPTREISSCPTLLSTSVKHRPASRRNLLIPPSRRAERSAIACHGELETERVAAPRYAPE